MRLSAFIHSHKRKIIQEWVTFASSLLPWAKGLSVDELRDHADELLTAVVADLESPESAAKQSAKSKGTMPPGRLGVVGRSHASQRAESGLDLDQLVSEYRALRASVLRLWEGGARNKQGEMTRFNEAIDETLAESAARYSEVVNATREQFLAILGHDLRTPLSSIVMGAGLLTASEELSDKNARVASRILSSANRMERMIGDLLDLTRTRLGAGLPITTSPIDLTDNCELVLSELQVVHPSGDIQFEPSGDLRGNWDGDRLTQVISNLVANALQYGHAQGAVRLLAHGEAPHEVVLEVHNAGPPISKTVMRSIFDPMVRATPQGQRPDKNATGLGLGLYIARQVVVAHGGTLEVTSTVKDGTTFTVRLPRGPPAKGTHRGKRPASRS